MSNSQNTEQDVIELTHKILDKLGLEIPEEELDNYEFLKSDAFYIQIFKTIVGNSPTYFNEEEFTKETEGMTEGQTIQALIDKLDSEILQIDLTHIKGENIAKGEMKDITNILQLLDLLSVSEEQEEEEYDEGGIEEQGRESRGGDLGEKGGTGEVDYEMALNNSESLEEERNLNIDSSNRVNNPGRTGGGNLNNYQNGGIENNEEKNNYKSSNENVKDNFDNNNMRNFGHEFGDAADAIKTEEELMQVMERDGEIKFTNDNEEDFNYNENNNLEPKMKNLRKKGRKKSQNKSNFRGKMRKKEEASKATGRKRSMKREIVSKIEDNIYGKKRRKKLRKKKLTKTMMPKLTPQEQFNVVNAIKDEEQDLNNEEEAPFFYSDEMLQAAILKGEQEKMVEEMLKKQKRKYKQNLNEYIDYMKKKENLQLGKGKSARHLSGVGKMKAMHIYQKKIEEELKNEEMSMHYRFRDEQANYMRYV